MNQGRVWCVVNPTVGLPLLLGSVAITSLIVHASVMTHVTWMGNYWSGASAKVAMDGGTPNVAPASSRTANGFSMTVTPVAATSAAAPASFMITLTPAPAAAAVQTEPASAETGPPPYHAASAN